jgi:hypothetical protein
MLLTVMRELAKGLANEQSEGPKTTSADGPSTEGTGRKHWTVDIGNQLERMKWFLWHASIALTPSLVETGRFGEHYPLRRESCKTFKIFATRLCDPQLEVGS